MIIMSAAMDEANHRRKSLSENKAYVITGLYGACRFYPARLPGIEAQVGALTAGKKANLILIDDRVRVKSVFPEGKLMAIDGKLA